MRKGRRANRGQVMLLFALMAIVLLTIAGLAVDAGMSYFSSDQVERAAASAALAGVAYLPSDFADAQNAALVEASRNGFTSQAACPNAPTCVTVQQPSGTTNQLEVTVNTRVPTTFLALLGFGAHTVSRTATAEFLPPVALGQPGALQGSVLSGSCNGVGVTTAYCQPTSLEGGLGSGGSNFYFERTEGYGNPRSEGDPYMPTPLDQPTSCGTPAVPCVAAPADYHQISPMDNHEKYYGSLDLNYTGGSNYLIAVPPGQSVDVQVYNPGFAPDSADQSNTNYTYHEDDSSFTDLSAKATDYAAMSYTVFSVPTLSSDLQDTPISQTVFYPYNATCLDQGGNATGTKCSGNTTGTPLLTKDSYYWFPPTGSSAQPPTTVPVTTSTVPQLYHNWVSVLDPVAGNDSNLFKTTMLYANGYGTNELSNPATATNDLYFRLEVDTLQWNGVPACGSATCARPNSGTVGTTNYTTSNGQASAHKGYAVQLVAPGTINTCSTASPPAQCPTATMSAMSDMTVYTPIESQSTSSSFSIPLFQLDPSYANQPIDVYVFDPGDVSYQSGHQGSAYMGIQEPGGTWAPASISSIGNSIGSGGGTGTVASAWPTAACRSGLACFQTATSSGSIYNGQWLKLEIKVPGTVSNWNAYWNLVYYVSPYAQAGDTFAVQVGFAGSPDRLLP
jgi:Flp pilus assembly protein TadG